MNKVHLFEKFSFQSHKKTKRRLNCVLDTALVVDKRFNYKDDEICFNQVLMFFKIDYSSFDYSCSDRMLIVNRFENLLFIC